MKTRTLNESNVVRFWFDVDEQIVKLEMIEGNVILLKKGDNLLSDFKILNKDTKNFVKLFGKSINKHLIKKIERIVDPEFTVIISMKNGKQYRIDSKQRVSRGDYNLIETYNYIKNLLH